MERETRTSFVGGLLIAVGVLLLLDRSGWLAGLGSWLWGPVFLAGGLAFLWVFYADRRRWWALFPGCGLVGLAAAVLMGNAGGVLFLALMGLAFALVYAADRRRWWAILPAGGLATLALVAWIDTASPGYDSGWVFFAGLAVTFAALAFLPAPQRQGWAIYPALGSAALAVVLLLAANVAPVVIALVLIGIGAVMLWRRYEGEATGVPRRRSRT